MQGSCQPHYASSPGGEHSRLEISSSDISLSSDGLAEGSWEYSARKDFGYLRHIWSGQTVKINLDTSEGFRLGEARLHTSWLGVRKGVKRDRYGSAYGIWMCATQGRPLFTLVKRLSVSTITASPCLSFHMLLFVVVNSQQLCLEMIRPQLKSLADSSLHRNLELNKLEASRIGIAV